MRIVQYCPTARLLMYLYIFLYMIICFINELQHIVYYRIMPPIRLINFYQDKTNIVKISVVSTIACASHFDSIHNSTLYKP